MDSNELVLFVITLALTLFHMARAASEIHFSWGMRKHLPRELKGKDAERDADNAEQLVAKGWKLNKIKWYTVLMQPKNMDEALALLAAGVHGVQQFK